jgi:predicted DNA-binding protein YlxM (UPF0122 family)
MSYRYGEKHPNWKGGIYINPHNGYCYFNTAKNRKKLVHRVIWEQYFGKIPEGYEIHHKNGNKLDNRIENLELVKKGQHQKKYHLELIKKMCKKTGKLPKLTQEQIKKIRELRKQGFKLKEIAKLFNVSIYLVWNRLRHDYKLGQLN